MPNIPTNYSEARDIYEDRRKRGILKRGVRLANNTYLSWQDEIKPMTSNGLTPSPSWFGVRLHKTNVVTFHSDGSIVLDSGGWKTVTTKDRINCALPPGWSVYSTRGVWYLSQSGAKGGTMSLSCHGGAPPENFPNHVVRMRWFYDRETETSGHRPEASPFRWTTTETEIHDPESGPTCPKCGARAGYVGPPVKSYAYADGIVIHGPTADHAVTGEGEDPKAQAKLRKRAKAYAKAYVKALYAGELPSPSGGDCWGCALTPVNGKASPHAGLAGPDHMLSHLDEKYYVPSLVLRALDRFGGSQAAQHDVACLLWPDQAPKRDDGTVSMFGCMEDQVLRMVRRHVYEQLGLGA